MALYIFSERINNSIYEQYGNRWYTADDDPVALLRAEAKLKNPWVIKKIRAENATTILDIGCGAGFLSNALALEEFKVTAVDLSQESLNIATNYDTTKTVRYVQADAFHLPFADNSFDVVTAMDFLEHIEEPEKAIKELSRVLKTNGIFIYHTFNRNWVSWLIVIKFVEWLVRNAVVNMHILRLFIKPQELIQYCKNAGLINQEITGIKPDFSSIPLKNWFSGIVPRCLKFEFTSSLKLSYIGIARKCPRWQE
jgi:2-polyprenyl-6-hydroxyphenyl methylase/3-demethylubiquinone-9 3-methyltransferase